MQDDCGTWVTALCPYGADGCPDNMGDYDVTMPDPMTGTSGDSYKIRVMNVADESQVDCSDEFYLMAEAEVPITAAIDGAYLIVTSPAEGDVAEPGGEYTVLVRLTTDWDAFRLVEPFPYILSRLCLPGMVEESRRISLKVVTDSWHDLSVLEQSAVHVGL